MSFAPQTIVLVTLGASLLLFVTDALRYDAVAILVVLVLGATGCLSPQEAFSGFSNPVVVMVAGLLIVGEILTRTGVAFAVGNWLTRVAYASKELPARRCRNAFHLNTRTWEHRR